MPIRPCLDCGTLTQSTRCPPHQRPRDLAALRGKRARRPRATPAEDRRRRDTVDAWRAQHGNWCPGWLIDPHPSDDLTADHIHAVGAGGSEYGELGVLCRSCNARKSATI
jgi:5-methylcytosine-specific restriction protein A